MLDDLLALGRPSSETLKLNLYCNFEHLIYQMDDLLVLDDTMDELEIVQFLVHHQLLLLLLSIYIYIYIYIYN